MKPNGRSERATYAIASLLAAPILLQPLVVILSVFWARYESVLRHPDLAARNPPTVSRAIVDPAIGDPFANLMLICFAMLLYSVWRIGAAFYRPGLSQKLRTVWIAILFCEFVAAIGMVVLSQYTGAVSDSLHLLGSYMLFFGHGVGIPLSGIFILMDRKSRQPALAEIGRLAPLPYYPKVHPQLAHCVALCALSFGGLYFGWEHVKAINNYGARVVFSMAEIVLLVAFETYVGSFTLLMFRYEGYRLRNAGQRVPIQEGMAASAE